MVTDLKKSLKEGLSELETEYQNSFQEFKNTFKEECKKIRDTLIMKPRSLNLDSIQRLMN